MKNNILFIISVIILLVCITNVNALVTYNEGFENGFDSIQYWILSGTANITSFGYGLNDSNYSFNASNSGGFIFGQQFNNTNDSLILIHNVTYLINFSYDTEFLTSGIYVGVGSNVTNPLADYGLACIFYDDFVGVGLYCDYNFGYFPLVPVSLNKDNTYLITYKIDTDLNEWYLYIDNNYISFNPADTGNADGGISLVSDQPLTNFIIYADSNTEETWALIDDICVYNGTYSDCDFTFTPPQAYIPNMTVNFISPTPSNNTVSNNTFFIVNVSTSQDAINCNLTLNNSQSYNMSNRSGTVFTYNVTNLLNGTYSYSVNCSTVNVSNISETRYFTVNQSESNPNPYIPNMTVLFISPTYSNNSQVSNSNFTFINISTSQSVLFCNLSFNGTYYNMSNRSGTVFSYNVTQLNTSYQYNYYVNCSSVNVSNISETRYITFLPCTNNYTKTVQQCIGGAKLIVYTDNNMCMIQTGFPLNNGTYELCNIVENNILSIDTNLILLIILISIIIYSARFSILSSGIYKSISAITGIFIIVLSIVLFDIIKSGILINEVAYTIISIVSYILLLIGFIIIVYAIINVFTYKNNKKQ